MAQPFDARAGVLLAMLMLLALAGGAAMAQSVEFRHWHGVTAMTRQPEQVIAGTMAEWRGLWSRVGLPAPDMFEQGRMRAVGIFLGRRAGEGYTVNILSTSRRRNRIVVVFEERMPPDVMLEQRMASRPVASGPTLGSTKPDGMAGFAAPGTPAITSVPSPPASRPTGQPTSPWSIILVHRGDLPVTVEQRLFR